MDIVIFARALKRHAILIVVICVTATAATWYLVPELLPETYTATTLVLVRPIDNVDITSKPFSKELLSFPVGGGMPPAEIPSNTYMRIIRSRAIAEKIVTLLALDRRSKAGPEEEDGGILDAFKSWLRNFGRSALHVLKYGRVLPQRSAFDDAVEEVQESLSLNAVRDAYQFEINFSYQDPEIAAAVANAAASLFLDHMAEMNDSASTLTLDYLEQSVEESRTRLAADRAKLADFKAQNATIVFEEEAAAEIRVIASLETSLEETEVELAGLGERLTPDNPKVQQLQAERARLLTSIQARKERINELPSMERRLTELGLNVQVSDEVYQLINMELETARVRAGNTLREIEVVSPAVAPAYPSGPIRIKFVGTALFLSLLIGTGLALLLDYLDTTLRSVEATEHALDLPVLATIPKMSRVSEHL